MDCTVLRYFVNYRTLITPRRAILVTCYVSDTSDHILIIYIDKTSAMCTVYVGRCDENQQSYPYCINHVVVKLISALVYLSNLIKLQNVWYFSQQLQHHHQIWRVFHNLNLEIVKKKFTINIFINTGN